LLRLVQDYRPSDDVEEARVAVEFTLESHGGTTRVRLVHSGFGRGAAWDNEIDSISEGWPSELRSLRLYLQRHRSCDRHVARVALSPSTPLEKVWPILTGPGGFQLTPAELNAGDAFEVVTPAGERFSGTVEMYLPRRSFTGILRELDGALFRLTTWRDPSGKSSVWVWLASYDRDSGRARAFEAAAQQALKRLFPDG
jgi:hypothetical protein